MLINDRLSTILPTVGAFRRRSMQVKWLSCKGLTLKAEFNEQLQEETKLNKKIQETLSKINIL